MADFGYSGKNFANEVHQIIGSKVETVDPQVFTIESKEQNKFEVRVNKDINGNNYSTAITL